MTENTESRCFVIMPFTKTTSDHTEEYWMRHYNDFLKPLIESHKLITHRSSPLRGDILRQIITDLVTSPLVIADLTDANPNVYWELGVRQSFKHCTITVAEIGTKLPFDLGGKGTLFYYPKNHIKMEEFKIQFDNAIHDCLKNPATPDSHVLETISGRGTLFQIITKEESFRKLDAVSREIQHNIFTMNDAKKTYTNNAKIREQRKQGGNEHNGIQYITNRLRTVALEHLIVDRYIDTAIDFYVNAEDYWDKCIGINAQIEYCDLAEDEEVAENWLLTTFKEATKVINKFKKSVLEHQNKIHSSI